LPSWVRGRAARMLVILAEDRGDEDLANRALARVQDLAPNNIELLSARLIRETVFGSSDAALALAEELRKLSTQARETWTRTRALHNAGIAFFRCGNISRGIECLEEVFALAHRTRDWGECTKHATALAAHYWGMGDLPTSELWLDRAEASSLRSANHTGRPEITSLQITLALDKGNVDTAKKLLDDVEERYPRTVDDRIGLERLAYRLRIGIALGQMPADNEVEQLVSGHLARRHLGLQDVVADATIRVLVSVGRGEEAKVIRDEYIFRYRRDGYPIARCFQGLSPSERVARTPTRTGTDSTH
jgi:hypothetical protein